MKAGKGSDKDISTIVVSAGQGVSNTSSLATKDGLRTTLDKKIFKCLTLLKYSWTAWLTSSL